MAFALVFIILLCAFSLFLCWIAKHATVLLIVIFSILLLFFLIPIADAIWKFFRRLMK